MEAAQQVGKYTLQEYLGRGSTAEVWKAVDTILQREVAIKFLLPHQTHSSGFAQRFQREVKAIVSLEHPNIIQIYDISANSSDSNSALPHYDTYMVMQYIAGPTLASYIAQTSRAGQFLSNAEVLRLFTAIGSAIDYAHQHGMIHRDIKPTNILLDQQQGRKLPGNPILTDFGLVKFLDLAPDSWQSTSTVLGTPHYVAPEQALGREVTSRSDLYSLGVVLYEVCTGRLPYDFPAQSTPQSVLASLMQQIMFAPIPPSHIRPDISPALEAVILKSIAKEPDQRFSDAASMCDALRKALTTSSPVLRQVLHKQAAQQRKARPETRPQQDMLASSPSSTKPDRQPSSSKIYMQKRQKYRLQRHVPLNPPATTHRARRTTRSLKITAITLVSLFLIGFMLFLSLNAHRNASYGQTAGRQTASATPIGRLLFLSSGQGNATQNQGVNDNVQIDLSSLSAPGSGKKYYAWLVADDSYQSNHFVFLGALDVQHLQAHLTYSQPQHNNLLMTMSRFLVTQENAVVQPTVPSHDPATWYLVGSIAQTPNPHDQERFSVLDHLRHLLATDPKLKALGIEGGLNAWLDSNTQGLPQLAQKALQSANAKNGNDVHNQLVRLLDYLDGTRNVAGDIPPGSAVLVNAPSARIGLLQTHAYQDPPSYLYHIDSHLMALVSSPGVTTEQQKMAVSITSELNVIQSLLQQVRTISKDLVALPPNRLLQADVQSQLTTLLHLTVAIYNGPDTTHPGIHAISQQILALASMPLTLYHA